MLLLLAAAAVSGQDAGAAASTVAATKPATVTTAATVGAATTTSTTGTAAAAVDAKSGEELKQAIEDNSEAQEYKEDTKQVNAQIVKTEAAATLESGTGDVATTGAHTVCSSACGAGKAQMASRARLPFSACLHQISECTIWQWCPRSLQHLGFQSACWCAGACNVEVDQFCFEVQPGEGRLAKCLDDQLVSPSCIGCFRPPNRP